MDNNDFYAGELVMTNNFSTTVSCAMFDDPCGCEGGEGSCECGYDPECE